MKITTWNVNGIRAAASKGLVEWWAKETPDVLCLQEIKAREEQVDDSIRDFPGYHKFWNPAERPGYSGVATFSKIKPLEFQSGFDLPVFDVEGRVMMTRFAEFYLFNVYFPNGQRDQERLDFKLDFYESFLDHCNALVAAGHEVVITGDFNTAHQEIDLANPKSNQKTSGFLPEERAWIDTYLSHGYVDAFRHLYPERVQYTWWTYRFGARSRNVGWRLDYYLVSKGLQEKVVDVVIHDDVMGSDHCPVSLILNL